MKKRRKDYLQSLCAKEAELVRLFDLMDYFRVVIPAPPKELQNDIAEAVNELRNTLFPRVRSLAAFLVDVCERAKTGS